MANNCGQVNTPKVDNSQDECDFITGSECVIVNRRSTFIKNVPGQTLDEYLQAYDDKLNKLQNQLQLQENIIRLLQEQIGISSGIGIFD